jgi:C-terminal processing protease CtpA/Prc
VKEHTVIHRSVAGVARRRFAAAVLLLVALGVPGIPATAGETSGYRCPKDTQTCLDEMVARLKKSGWMGIEYDEKDSKGGITVRRVVPGSPAEAAGIKPGDRLVSVDGARFGDNTAERCVTCEKTKDRWVPGQKFDYVLQRAGQSRHVPVTLAALPSDVMAQMIGMHMIDHARPPAR